jgi:Flp pilus assembly protein TadG
MSTRGDAGSSSIEAAIIAPAFLALLAFGVGGLRIVGANGDVTAAAHEAARAAGSSYSFGSAQRAALRTASAVFDDRGVSCSRLRVTTGGSLEPGGVVTVTVRCTVTLADVVLSGLPGSRTVEVTASEAVDVLRGGGGR